MLNEGLVNHYLSVLKMSVSDKSALGVITSDKDYSNMLNDSGIDWTYEIVGEYFVDDLYNITVAVYIPGQMRMGLGSSDKEFGREYRKSALSNAIAMACKQLRVGRPTVTKDTVEEPVKTEEPAKKKSPYSDEQLNRMKKFKADCKVTNDEQLMSYIKAWDSTITSKGQLTPKNIDTFLDWIEEFGQVDL